MIGTTETAGISEDDASVGDRPNERLADTIMLVRVEPATQQASVLSVNRDLWIPDVAGYRGRINGAYQAGDADLLITVLREYLGVEINDVVKVNFAGFEAVVDELGGVPVYFEHPTFDEGSFFAVDAGCHVLDGETALAYVRSRKMSITLPKGSTAKADSWSDRDRAARQRDFLILTMQRAVERGARDPGRLRGLIDAVANSGAVVLDDKLSPRDLVDIAGAFGDFEPENLQRYAIETTDGWAGSQQVLFLDEDRSRPVLDIFRGLGNTVGNTDVRVDVADGRAPEERANDVAPPDRELAGLGFDVGRPRVLKEAERTARSTITYSPDEDRAALLLARNLATRPQFVPVIGRDKLTLTIGSDWRGVTLAALPEEDFAGALPVAPLAPSTTVAGVVTTSSVPTPTEPADVDTGQGVIGKPAPGVPCD